MSLSYKKWSMTVHSTQFKQNSPLCFYCVECADITFFLYVSHYFFQTDHYMLSPFILAYRPIQRLPLQGLIR